jgi:hypothetical protein
MPLYRVYRIKEAPGEQFRWAPHTGGLATVKQKDYDLGEQVEGATPYAVWKQLEATGRKLTPGDLLETVEPDGTTGPLQVAKYIGFEPAQWYVPEVKASASETVIESRPPNASVQIKEV